MWVVCQVTAVSMLGSWVKVLTVLLSFGAIQWEDLRRGCSFLSLQKRIGEVDMETHTREDTEYMTAAKERRGAVVDLNLE